MAKTIWKFELHIEPLQYISIPAIYEVLTVQVQRGKPCLWAIVDPGKRETHLGINCYPTGGRAPENIGPKFAEYLGTVQIKGKVWHFFS